MMKRPWVAGEVKRRQAELQRKYKIDLDMCIREYAKVAFVDMDTYLSWGPGGVVIRESNTLPRGAMAAVAEVEQTRWTTKIKLHPKIEALDSIVKTLGLGKLAASDERPTTVAIMIVSPDGSERPLRQHIEEQRRLADGK